MKRLSQIMLGFLMILTLIGCSTKSEELYYKAVNEQNSNYMKSYEGVENESVTFNGTFNGEMKIVKPKKLPQLAQVRAPKTSGEIALEFTKALVPGVAAVAGMHYGYKAIESSNNASVAQTEAYTGNYQNNTSTTNTSSISDTSVSDTSSVSDNTSVTNPTDFTTDGSTTSITNP